MWSMDRTWWFISFSGVPKTSVKIILAKTTHLYIIISVVKSMSDICESLIDHEANRIDEEW